MLFNKVRANTKALKMYHSKQGVHCIATMVTGQCSVFCYSLLCHP